MTLMGLNALCGIVAKQ